MTTSLSRRRFLQTTTAAWAAGWSVRSLAEESGLELGFSLYGMKSLTLPEALKTCSETGYRNVELALNAGFPTDLAKLDAAARADLRTQLAKTKLTASALMLNMSLAADDAAHAAALVSLKAAGELARELQQAKPPVIESVLGGKPAEWEKLKAHMVERLHDWAETAAAAQATVAIKAHVGSAVNTPERLLWLFDQVKSPALVIAYDYSHFEVAGIPLEESLKALMPHTRFVHVKDSAGDPAKFQFLLPGEGRTDYAAYFKLLKALGYRGPVVVEVSAQIFNKPGYDPVKAAKDCYAALAPKL